MREKTITERHLPITSLKGLYDATDAFSAISTQTECFPAEQFSYLIVSSELWKNKEFKI